MGEEFEDSKLQEQAKETGTSVRESKCRIDVRLFLDEYPRWELGILTSQ